MEKLAGIIKNSKSIVLSTHRECDGDGLGAQLALFHGLKKSGYAVQIINVDPTPRKYEFLNPHLHIQYYEQNPNLPTQVDLALVFDTNDERLLGSLKDPLKRLAKKFLFLDHHPILTEGPKPSADSVVDIKAASTGELTFFLLKALHIELDASIAQALYTSITFDTQLYRFIRNSPNSHLIAAELLKYDFQPEHVHRHLFGTQTVQKIAFLAKALGQIEYFAQGRIAVLKLKDKDLFHYGLEPDESRDVIDFIMNIQTLEAAALFREDSQDEYKLSLRSKGEMTVLPLAESLGGGGHIFASGAFLKGKYENLKKTVVQGLTDSLNRKPLSA